jgi:hypothetical protein
MATWMTITVQDGFPADYYRASTQAMECGRLHGKKVCSGALGTGSPSTSFCILDGFGFPPVIAHSRPW